MQFLVVIPWVDLAEGNSEFAPRVAFGRVEAPSIREVGAMLDALRMHPVALLEFLVGPGTSDDANLRDAEDPLAEYGVVMAEPWVEELSAVSELGLDAAVSPLARTSHHTNEGSRT